MNILQSLFDLIYVESNQKVSQKFDLNKSKVKFELI